MKKTKREMELEKEIARLRELLNLAGCLSESARDLIGGARLGGPFTMPSTVWSFSHLCEALRQSLDAYDAAIMKAAKESSNA